MNKRWNVWAVLLAASVALAGCSGNGGPQESETPGEAGEDGIKLKFTRISYNDVRPPSKDLWMWQKYEEMTGIQIEWEEISSGAVNERKNVILGSNDLPDAFYQLGFSQDELIKYGQQGLFIPLEDLIEEHAPNLKKLFDENPDIKKTLTMPDGHIYSLPYVDFAKAYATIRLYINKTWLDNLGLPVPETTDELRDTLKAFATEDANGNGDPNDEYGWVMPSSFINWSLERQLLGSFGMGNGGGKAAANWIYKDKDGQLKTIFNDPKYKEVWKYMNELWNDGSIPQNNFSGYEYAQWVADAAQDRVGAFSWADPYYIGGEELYKNYIGINVLEGPEGDKVVNWMDPPTRGTSSFTITNKNQHPVETIKWVDYFYGEEGSLFGYFGIEGETYHMVDGKPEYIDEIKNYKGGVQLGAFQYVDNVYGGYFPYVEPPAELRTSVKGRTLDEEILANAEELELYAPEEIWPAFTPTEEESKRTNAILTDINKYITEMRVNFVTGNANFESDWENYVNTLDRMGAQDYLEIRRAQYERYMNQD